MALPPTIAPAPHAHHHNPAQELSNQPSPRDHQITSTHSPASSRDYEQSAMQRSSPPSPRDYNQLNNLDPAIGGTAGMMSTGNDSGGDDSPSDGRKGYGKRELSTSKRAAQNRAAQRAFRQRKEGYIKKLEEQVRDYSQLSESYKAVQAENYQLRDYIINLQSRLIESQGDYPQPPPNVDLAHPPRRQGMDLQESQRPAPAGYDALSQLRASAAQAGHDLGLGVPSKHGNDESHGLDGQVGKRMKDDNESAERATATQESLQGPGMAVESRLANSPQTRDLTIGSVLNRNTRDSHNGRPLLST